MHTGFTIVKKSVARRKTSDIINERNTLGGGFLSNMKNPYAERIFRIIAVLASVFILTAAFLSGQASAMSKSNRKTVEKLYRKNVRIYEGKTLGKWSAHRGYSDMAPGNSEEAFLLAAKCGAFAIEGDVQSSKDGIPYMFHDSRIDATTNKSGRLEDFKSSEISKIRIDSGNGIGLFGKVRICSFRKYLRICRRYGCYAVIDVKDVKSEKIRRKFVRRMKKILKQEGMTKRCKIISFYWPMLKAWREVDSKISCRLMDSRFATEEYKREYRRSLEKTPGKIPNELRGYAASDSPVVSRSLDSGYLYELTKKGPKSVSGNAAG